ncbi:multicopper oxidase family protein [Rhizobium sp. G21]|uniref:multicopper oxidase family protein n=1 Tax=Rhizobium sp. G21 TaxID=2758439 RepID=UPI0015FEE67D|nr:multicopper oxidase domain-containing protein [Rhizobium sp. G21]MBB1250371.1 multicopper oxidase domain-containing protein [Rhizobium sp. G21]
MKRRGFLAGAVALAGGAAFGLPAPARAAARALTISTRTLEVNGRAATVFGLTAPDGRPGLTFSPGERFRVDLANRLKEETIVHWHGLTPPIDQDGVAHAGGMLKPGETRAYDFPLDRPGTYWMHAHSLQEQNLLAAPLIVHSKEDLTADRQEVVMLLHDFSFTPAEELLGRLTSGQGHGGMKHGAMDHGTMDHSSMNHDAMGHGSMDHASGMSASMMAMDLNDIEYDAYLANDRTLDDPEIVTVERAGRVLLRIINGAASTGFTIDTGALTAQAVAVDGQPITPVEATLFPLTMGQRVDLLLDIPKDGSSFPILARREGTAHRTGLVLATKGAATRKIAPLGETAGPVLDLAFEAKLQAAAPLPVKAAAKRFMVHLTGDMASYRWGMAGAEDITAAPGERIEISMMNMSMMAHPMHLHGHHFQVTAIDGAPLSGALRDTVLVPPMKTVTIAFDAGTQGDWAFHCHHLYHMVQGMMAHVKVG